MPKNIVVCCDGTGNKFCEKNSNVVKLYQSLDLSDPAAQIAYYHGGLGTLGAPSAFTRLARWWSKVIGLAFGYGLAKSVGDAYAFLMDNYEEGDKVFLLGFSRGAYAARALSGMLHMFGLIRKGDYDLIPYATEMLKAKKTPNAFATAAEFKYTFSRECKPWFVGVWDTVSSVGWIYDPLSLPYTARNPDVAIGRHAISIDERRCMFRQNLWGKPFDGQDLKQVWFAGVHSDVGGGYAQNESGLSNIALEWMLCEARKAGMVLNLPRATAALGMPDPAGKIHNSLLDGGWFLLEALPHRYTDMTCEPPRSKLRIPFGRRRHIAEGSTLHSTVSIRTGRVPEYRPPNVPKSYTEEPWVRLEQDIAARA